MTKLKVTIYQDFINKKRVRQQRAKIRIIDCKNTDALKFLKMLCGYLSLDETTRIVLKRIE